MVYNYNPLNPFRGRQAARDNLPSGPSSQNLPSGHSNVYDADNLRSVGIRAPTVLVGWGYDIHGRPVPNNIGSLSGLNNNYNYNSIAFSGGQLYPSGGSVEPHAYVAGPIDLPFNYRTGCWQSDRGFFAKIIGSTGMRYAWEEVLFSKTSNGQQIESDIDFVDQAIGGTGITQQYAFNIIETGPVSVVQGRVPSGTIVKMYPIRVWRTDTFNPELYDLHYYFDSSSFNDKILAVVTDNTNVSIGKWSYECTLCELQVSATGTRPVLSATTVTAWNLVETMNTSTFYAPGITVANLPGGFDIQPIQDTVVELSLIPGQAATYYFSVTNAIDGECE